MTLETDLARLSPHLDLMTEAERQAVAHGLVPQLVQRCADDGRFWLRFVTTRDEADPTAATKPFPLHPYLLHLWQLMAEHQQVCVAKSRQMMVSWIVAAFAVWTARSKPHQAVYWQSQQYSDAAAMVALASGPVEGRCQFLESHLDPWLRQSVKATEGLLQYPNGSSIVAVAGGADKVRGKVFSVYIGDEFAYQEDQDGVLTTILPLIQKGSKAILVSTPNGSNNAFCTVYHGRQVAA